MNLNQDLIEWLRTTKTEEKNNLNPSEGTGLLLAPMDVAQPEEKENTELESEIEIKIEPEDAKKISEELQEIQQTVKTLQDTLETETEIENPEPKITPEVKNLSEWHEAATKYDLSLDEPPFELWTQISESIDEDEDYEQSMSLQGNAYIQLPTEHGKNFTQRLQQTLKSRQKQAEILREEEEKERQKNHPYFSKMLILCSSLIIEIALLCFLLFALNRYALLKKFNAKLEEPLIIQEEHKEEEIKTESKDEEKIEEVISEDEGHEIEIILPNLESKSKDIESNDESEIKEIKINAEEFPLTFEELLREANSSYNFKVYDMAILIFHRAMELQNDDIRPYIGLAKSYRAKKMYFDSKRILDEARAKFGRNPTIETELKTLSREE